RRDRRRGPAGGPVRLLHHGRDHRDPRWPARDDLGGHRRGRAGDRPVDCLAWPALPDRRGDPRRRLPGGPGPAGRRAADALHPAAGDGGLRQRPGDPDLHLAGVRADRRTLAGLPAVPPRGADRVPAAQGHHPGPRTAVGDKGELPDSLPMLMIPDVPLNVETLQIIAPYALGMALVGLMESLMTAKLVDDITDIRSNKTRESWAQGMANIVTGFFGGMGG